MRKQLSKSEIKVINEELERKFLLNSFFGKKDNLIYEELNDIRILKNNSIPCFFYYEGNLVPTLKLLLNHKILKEVLVDVGAIKFISSGADVMRPGIISIEDGINNHEFVVIKEESHNKPLAIGITLFSGDEIKKMKSGKVVKTIHYVGDKIWGF
jgi:PUA domain protein